MNENNTPLAPTDKPHAAFNRILDDAITGGLLNRNEAGYYMPGIEPKK